MAVLTNLPIEILNNICTSLCCHCRQNKVKLDKPSAPDISNEDYSERLGLRNLCLTSRSLRYIAQPILYHVFLHHCNMNWKKKETHLIPRLFRLLRTINENPHLSFCIKSIDIKAYEEKCDCCSPTADCATDEETVQVMRLSERTGLYVDLLDVDYDTLPEILTQFLLIMTPNLQKLSLCVPRWWYFQPLETWIHGHNESMTLLGQVRHMELEIERHANDMCFDEHDEDTCFHPTPPSPVERLLIDNASNIEVLSCTAGGLESLPKLPSLRRLHLHMKGSWEGMLPQLMDRLPHLTHFSYFTRNLHSPTPREIQDSLHNHHETLQHLTVVSQFWESISGNDLRMDPSRPYPMSSLADFKALETINLDGYMIWPHRNDGSTIQDVESDLQRLPKFLPQCIQQLHIDMDGWLNYGEENLRSLAKAVANGKFPYLQTVIWGMIHDRRHLRRETCNKAWEIGEDWREIIAQEVESRMRRGYHEAFPDWRAELLESAAKEAC
ncbi:hypothetical protein CSAL01_03670 [Colletotrichum salicis]|uniref:F-box domain-containing protein n=1 Tax=Colletotrichum salicis TaxID=1209931 RepID=A0A135RQH6_9PEZI|nr:hypothetical protein CSAL01_03670 [Colletotrichum salicis]